jgi:SAM-dependent methyltransferase
VSEGRDDTVAPDGSPVAFYRRLPASGEPELIHATVPMGASILDVGCGTGRISAPLAALGHPVTGIDNAARMISALPASVEGIVADATTVRLGRRFDVVLLASHLINDPDAGVAFARTGAAHLEPAGIVVGEAYPPGWDPKAAIGRPTTLGNTRITLLAAHLAGDRLDAEVEYAADGAVWRQPFRAKLLDEPLLRDVLESGGLIFRRWLPRPGWFVATRSSRPVDAKTSVR